MIKNIYRQIEIYVVAFLFLSKYNKLVIFSHNFYSNISLQLFVFYFLCVIDDRTKSFDL